MNEVPKMIRDAVVHADWYDDGFEDGENCWRMDYENVQVQLFAQPNQDSDKWPEFRLFIENDVRDASGDKRVRYASNGFPIDAEMATKLLAMSEQESYVILKQCIEKVKALPNDQATCDLSNR